MALANGPEVITNGALFSGGRLSTVRPGRRRWPREVRLAVGPGGCRLCRGTGRAAAAPDSYPVAGCQLTRSPSLASPSGSGWYQVTVTGGSRLTRDLPRLPPELPAGGQSSRLP